MQTPPKTVAVVVPLSNREELTPDEAISLRHLVHFLGKYDKFLVVPQNLKVNYPGFGIQRFPHKFFGSAAAHMQLMLSRKFYQTFQEYKYILLYHLDALVFSDQLMQWCETNLDYIGAPFLTCPDSPWVKVPRVGNGGFSLRKIESFLKVIDSPRYAVEPAKYWEAFYTSKPKYVAIFEFTEKVWQALARF